MAALVTPALPDAHVWLASRDGAKGLRAPCNDDQARAWETPQFAAAGYPGAYLETTLMNLHYWGAVNFLAIIIGH
jgi:hypothetical protein